MDSMVWAKQFGIDDAELTSLMASHGGAVQALLHCLKSGRISEADYLSWAQNKFSLARVKTEFFSAPADPVFWTAVKDLYKWHPGFFPLCDWQDVLLVGCVEPPQFHFRVAKETRFVLASVNSLETLWKTLEPNWKATEPKPVAAMPALPTKPPPPPAYVPPKVQPSEKAEEIKLDLPPPTVKAPPAYVPPATPKTAPPPPAPAYVPPVAKKGDVTADQLPPAPDVDLNRPDGFSLDIPADNDRLFVVPEGIPLDHANLVEKPKVEAPPPTKSEAPAGLSDTFTESRIDFAVAVTSPSIDLDRTEPAAADKTEPAMVESATAPVSLVPPPKATATATQDDDDYSPMEVTSAGIALNNSTPFESCMNLNDLVESALGSLQPTFEHGMFLLVREKSLVPWKWTDLLHSVKGKKVDAINLATPSIFRIPLTTKMPYHGYVTPNNINSAFFNNFHRGMLPKHVTVVPVVKNGEVVGMLLGITNREIDFRESLISTEKLAVEFAEHFGRVQNVKAAA